MWPHLLHTSTVSINRGSSHRRLSGISVNRKHSLTVSCCHYYNLFLPLFSMAFCHSKYSINVYFWLWIWRRRISANNIFAQVVSWEGVPGSLFIGYPELLMKSVGIQELDTQNSSTWVLRHCCLRTTDKPPFQAQLLLQSQTFHAFITERKVKPFLEPSINPGTWKSLKTWESPQFQEFQRRHL